MARRAIEHAEALPTARRELDDDLSVQCDAAVALQHFGTRFTHDATPLVLHDVSYVDDLVGILISEAIIILPKFPTILLGYKKTLQSFHTFSVLFVKC